MPFSYTESTASAGQHLVNVSWPYISKTDVHVTVDAVELDQGALVWNSDSQIDIATANGGNLAGGEVVRVYRQTPADNPTVTFQAGIIKHADLNAQITQLLYIVQEAYDIALIGQDLLPTVEADAASVATALASITAMYGQISTWNTAVSTAVTAAQGYAASTASDASDTANDVLASDANAQTATTKATAAATSETNAAASATSAASSASAAATAQTAAESARDQTLAAFANFNDKYLGEKATAPSLDNDGNALVGGALYYSTESGNEGMKVWTGSAWAAAYVSGSGFMAAANNLSELTSTATARLNLGLGNVDNTSDANKPVSTATQTALNAKLDYDADLNDVAGLSPANDDFMQRKGGHWTNRTVAQVWADLQATAKSYFDTVYEAASSFAADVRAVVLTGLSTSTSSAITATDTVLQALGKLQAQITTHVNDESWFAITYAATITINHASGANQKVTLTGSPTFAAPSNGRAGVPLNVWITQDATGGRAITWDAVFDFGDFGLPTGSTGANQQDVYMFLCLSSTKFAFMGMRRRVD